MTWGAAAEKGAWSASAANRADTEGLERARQPERARASGKNIQIQSQQGQQSLQQFWLAWLACLTLQKGRPMPFLYVRSVQRRYIVSTPEQVDSRAYHGISAEERLARYVRAPVRPAPAHAMHRKVWTTNDANQRKGRSRYWILMIVLQHTTATCTVCLMQHTTPTDRQAASVREQKGVPKVRKT
jgi:hypothetical protein